MRTRVLLVSLAAIITAAQAGDEASASRSDRMEAFYGNTLISRDRGVVTHFYYNPDHTFTGTVPAYYMRFKGTWYEKADGTVCRVFDPPLPTLQNPDCGPMLVARVGDMEREPNGDAEKLVQGIR